MPLTQRRRCACLVAAAAIATAATTAAVAQTAPTGDAAPTTSAAAQPAPASDDAQTTPPGMERYDHPVYRDGRLILWHGAWRDRVKPKDQGQSPKDQAQGPKDQRQTAAVPAPAKPSPRMVHLQVAA